MKVRKAIKNIVALGTGLTMLGATVFGAVADGHDLGHYPQQYIEDGKFDGLLVLGDRASSEDLLGSIDIATSLQFASKTDRVVSGTTTTTLTGDVYQFGSSADLLELGESLGDVKSTLTADDMAMLESRSITTSAGSTDVDQYLKFNETSGLRVVFTDNKENIVADYLSADNGGNMFTYELQFPEGLESQTYESTSSTTTVTSGTAYLNDLDEEDLFILGETFNIVEVKLVGNASGRAEITLMGGALTDTLREGESRTYELEGKTYEVSVLIISDSNTGGSSEPKVKFMVNGEVTKSLSDGDTETLDDGTVMGIRSLLANEGAEEGGDDIVEFYIGANKVELIDTDYGDSDFNSGVEIDEESIDDADVKIIASWSSDEATITSIEYKLDADAAVSGDVYIAEGGSLRESLDEPEGLLSAIWDVKYEGLSEPTSSNIEVTPSGDESYNLIFTNQEGLEYDVPFVDHSNDEGLGWKLGDEEDNFVFIEQDCTQVDVNNATIGIDDYFVVSDEAESDDAFSRVLTFESVDTSEGLLTFNDVAEGSDHEVQFIVEDSSAVAGNTTTTDLIVGGESYTVHVYNTGASAQDDEYKVCLDLDNSGSFEEGDAVPITVLGGAILSFTSPTAFNYSAGTPGTPGLVNLSGTLGDDTVNVSLQVLGKYTDDNADQSFTFTIDNTTGNEVDLDYQSNSSIELERENSKDSDIKEGMTKFGIRVYEDEPDDSSDADSLTIVVPTEQVIAQVFVTGGNATSSTGTNGNTVSEYTRIQVGKAVLDTTISSLSESNMVIIGGPCVNTVAAQVLGISSSQPGCSEGFPVSEGQGIIKMVENGDKIATLVAGWSAADTRQAAQVLANYEDYASDLMGKDEVVVAGTKIMAVTTEDDSASEDMADDMADDDSADDMDDSADTNTTETEQ